MKDGSPTAVTVFDDTTANVTFLMGTGIGGAKGAASHVGTGAYFEGTNIYVYIRGSQDDEGDWWRTDGVREARRNEKGLTLVNAHYDS